MKLQDAILSIGKKSPFYHYILMGMKFIPDKKIRNLKLSFSKEGDLVLYYNEEKLEKKDIRMIEALLIHEIIHFNITSPSLRTIRNARKLPSVSSESFLSYPRDFPLSELLQGQNSWRETI